MPLASCAPLQVPTSNSGACSRWHFRSPANSSFQITAVAFFTFMGNYQSFFWPLIMVKDDYLRTLPIGLLYFDSSYGRETSLLMAASVMAMIPLIVLFVVGQRFFVKGIQLGAVKG